jgi:hypothetical protein
LHKLFKWIKQHLKIKSFYRTTRNDVYSQIWIAMCTFFLITIAKKRMRIEQSLYNFFSDFGLNPIRENAHKCDI